MLKRTRQRRPQRGFSLVELMVGSAIGLLLVSAVVTLYVSSLGSSRNLALAARLNQDMRAAADLVARDLRRASFWDSALTGTTAIGSGSATVANPYRVVTTPDGQTVTQIEYAFSQEVENNAVDAKEQFGFRLTSEGVLEMKTEQGRWKAITNPGVVRIQRFDIARSETTVPLGDLCPTVCLPGVPNCPSTTVRRYDIVMDGQAAADSRVAREMRSTVRIRNDRLEGQCPA
jgi:prepilin peptidase dependent protein B